MDVLARISNRYLAEGRPRVWSLVVTVFGDVAAPRGGRLSTTRIADITGRIGIGEAALRTALSRLVSDGTLVRTRDGRHSLHALSPAAAEEAATASRVIYGPEETKPWQISIGERPRRALCLAPQTWLSRTADGPLRFEASPVADAPIRHGHALDPAHRRALDGLDADLGDLAELSGVTPAPSDATALRVLLVHRWRRIALRWPELPDEWLPLQGRGLRARVAAAHDALSPGVDAWADDPAHGARLPAHGPDAFARRPDTGRG